jgi:uncharacterized damage-inducible protein DinB
VADQKPPRVDGDERETLRALLQYQRDSLVRKVAGVGEEVALMKHMARAESLWIFRRFAGEDIDPPDDAVHPGDTVASAVEAYRATWSRVDALVAAAPDLGQECRETGGSGPVNLRWVLMHLLEETARHAGHADILRELVDGHTGR